LFCLPTDLRDVLLDKIRLAVGGMALRTRKDAALAVVAPA